MIICPSIKLVFVHIPKSGGNSIAKAIGRWSSRKPSGKHTPAQMVGYHTGERHGRVEVGSYGSDWTVAAIKRNPWDRAISLWTFMAEPADEPFADFLARLEKSPSRMRNRISQGKLGPAFVWEQRTWINKAVTFTGRFEHLQESCNAMLRVCGQEPVELERLNEGRQAERQHIQWTPETARTLERCWPRDCATLGYGPPC